MSDTSELSNLEQLRQRKEKLLLEQEVARLERKQQRAKAGGWAWWWTLPLAAGGGFVFLLGMADGNPVAMTIGFGGMVPLGMKLFFKRGK